MLCTFPYSERRFCFVGCARSVYRSRNRFRVKRPGIQLHRFTHLIFEIVLRSKAHKFLSLAALSHALSCQHVNCVARSGAAPIFLPSVAGLAAFEIPSRVYAAMTR